MYNPSYVDVYDIHRAVEDEATVPIYYESRLARLDLDEDEKRNRNLALCVSDRTILYFSIISDFSMSVLLSL